MTLKFNLLRKKPQDVATATKAPNSSECSHWELAPRWDSVEDMGHADRITHYVCTGCGQRVSRREVDALAS